MRSSDSPVVDVSDREIIVYADHPLYAQLRDGFPVWSFLHEQPGGVVVLLSDEPADPHGPDEDRRRHRRLRFHNPRQQKARSRAFWDEYLDTLLCAARAWKESHTHKGRELEVAGGHVTARLARMNGSVYEPEHYTGAELALTVAGLDVTIPDLSGEDLKALGNFLINYGHQMDTEPRE